MKSFNLDLSKFKKIGSDHSTTTLMHPTGHAITIAHSKLSKKLKDKLDNLPVHLFDGGTEEGAPEMGQDAPPPIIPNADSSSQVGTPPAPPQGAETPSLSQMFDPLGHPISSETNQSFQVAQPLPDKTQKTMALNPDYSAYLGDQKKTTQQVSYDGSQQNPALSMPGSTSNMDAVYAQAVPGYKEQRAAAYQSQKASDILAKAQLNAAQAQQSNLKNAQADFERKSQDLDSEVQDQIKDVKQNLIDPKRYVNNLSTGDKVRAAIGMIIGGLGGSDAPQRYFQQQIDNDIKAQTNNLAQRDSLIAANLKRTGNLRDAQDMTRAFYNNLYASQIDEAKAKAMSPMAAAQASQLAGQLKQQAGQALQQVAMRQMLSGVISGGMQLTPQMLEMMPELRERAVKLPGPEGREQWSLAPTKKDAEEVKDVVTTFTQMKDNLDAIRNDMDQHGRTYNPFGTRAAISSSLKNNVVMGLNELHRLKRLNDTELEAYKDQIASPGSWNQERTQAMLDVMHNFVDSGLQKEIQYHLMNGKYTAPAKASAAPASKIPGYGGH